MTKLKIINSDKTQILNVTKLKNSHFDKTKFMTKLKKNYAIDQVDDQTLYKVDKLVEPSVLRSGVLDQS